MDNGKNYKNLRARSQQYYNDQQVSSPFGSTRNHNRIINNSIIEDSVSDEVDEKLEEPLTTTNSDNNVTNGTNDVGENDLSEEELEPESKVSLKSRLRMWFFVLKILIPILLILMFIIFISSLAGGYISNNGHRNSSSSRRITLNNVGGVGEHFISDDDDVDNNSVVYIEDDDDVSESTTYDLDTFVAGAVYAKTGDGYDIEVYKVYAILIRTNIMSDNDGVFESSNFDFIPIDNVSSGELIKEAVFETRNELYLDENNSLVSVDFSHNDCQNCTIEDGLSLKVVNSLVTESGYNHSDVIKALYPNEDNSIIKVNISGSNLNLDIKDTNGASNILRNISLKNYLIEHGSSVDEYNSFIADSVEPYYGTKEGVVAAAVSLVNFLYDNYDLKLPYRYGGKYGYVGVNDEFGLKKQSPSGSYYYESMDCSGFVQWAIINGGFKDPSTGTAHFLGLTDDKCNITSSNCIGEIGDLIDYGYTDSNGDYHGHVQLILDVDEDNNTYYIAESTRGSKEGVITTTREMHKGNSNTTVYIIHMEDYYNNNVR